MGIFSFFKKRKGFPFGPSLSPPVILKQLSEDIPEFYKDSIHFKDYEEFLRHNEYGLALESLIEMADESGHYFSDHFWLTLAGCADKMGMNTQAEYSRQQIIRNEKVIGIPTPKCSTWYEAPDGMLQRHIVTKQYNEWTKQRRQKDKLDKLLKKDGFHMKSEGRFGTIYYIDQGKVLELHWEISGVPQYHILLEFGSLHAWSIPDGTPITPEEEIIIREKLQEWLKKKGLRSDLKQPE